MPVVHTESQRSFASARSWVAPILVGLLFFGMNASKNARMSVFQTDSDEGYALIQSLLVGRGHPLYLETYSDQPPGYTYLLLGFTKAFGESPEVARCLTLLIVSTYLATLYSLFCRRYQGWAGHWGGLVACLSLTFSSEFLRYSCAAMIGLPAVCVAGLAATVLGHAGRHPKGSTIVGGLLALSLWIKAIALPMVPVFLGAVLWDSWRRERSYRRVSKHGILFLASFSIFLTIGYLPVFLTPGKEILYNVHRLHTDRLFPGWPNTWDFIQADLWLVCPALAAGLLTIFRRNAAGFFSLVALLLGGLALSAYSPVWSHHRYLMLLPASALLGFGCSDLVLLTRSIRPRPLRIGSLAGPILLVFCCFHHIPLDTRSKTIRFFRNNSGPSDELRLVERLREVAPKAKSMATSQQMFAYRLGLEVPPQLAMTSRKRFSTHELDWRTLGQLVVDSDVDVILMDHHWPDEAREFVEQHIRNSHRRLRAHRDRYNFSIFIKK